MPYRPFGRWRNAGSWYPVGDQWPDAPDELVEAVDGRARPDDYNRFERAIYRWLARPRLWPRRRRG
jgi:hypothetical protein